MRTIVATTVSLSGTALLTFLIEANTQPSGPWVVPLLIAVLVVGGVYLLAGVPLSRKILRRVGVCGSLTEGTQERVAVACACRASRWSSQRAVRGAGHEIEQFVWTTNKSKPLLEVGVTPKDQWAFIRSRQRNHDLVALQRYEHRFSGQVFRLARELEARGYLTRDQADALGPPGTMSDVWQTGERLQQLALRLQTPALTAQ